MTDAEQITLKRELASLTRSQPHLSFQQAWSKLQSEKPYLFTDSPNPSLDCETMLAHNRDVRSKAEELMKYARGEKTYQELKKIQAVLD